MRIPSIDQALQRVEVVARRYPLELLVSLIGCITANLLTYDQTEDLKNYQVRILLTAALALPAFLAVSIRGRFRGLGNARRILEYLVVTVLLSLFFLGIHQPVTQNDAVRFVLLAVAAHLLVSCAGFLGRGSTRAFWQFNRFLFLRIITSVIFSGVLFAGLAGALAATGALFSLDVQDEWFGRIFICIAGIFNTVIFLMGVPTDADSLEREYDYPRVLKIFTQFVLVPLVLIYLAILLSYEAKIILQWELPNGWVSNLIIAFGIVGILSILLVYPIREAEDNKWIRFFSRWFYLLLLPLVALMFVAIGTRIRQYGFTEERIIVLALAIWLAIIALVFLLRPRSDIRIIPASLAFFALLLSLIAFPISRSSQRNKLEQMLSRNKMLSNGKAVPAPGLKLSQNEQRNLTSTIEYLASRHGVESLQPWFVTDTLVGGVGKSYDNTRQLLSAINVEYTAAYHVAQASPWRGFDNQTQTLDI